MKVMVQEAGSGGASIWDELGQGNRRQRDHLGDYYSYQE